MPDPCTIAESFDRIAANYDRYAALQQEAGRRLLDRVEFRRLEPARILDLGCGSGSTAAALKKTFRKARVLGLDLSPGMLAEARRKSTLTRPFRLLCADMARMPLAARSVDLVFANLSVLWVAQPEKLFAEVRRVLRPDGMFLFSGFGQGCLRQLSATWPALDERVQLPIFPDLLETGDALTAAGFREPVMDADRITLHYPALESLMGELEATGTAQLVRGWQHWRENLDALEQVWQPLRVEGRYPLSYEIVYGAAFGPAEGQPFRTPEGDVATFSVDSLLKSHRMVYS